MNAIIICPICNQPLKETATQYHCELQHSFDKARSGYVNLLLANMMRSKQPGDNNDMVKSRAHFLNKGHYAPIANLLNQVVEKEMQPLHSSPIHIADIGCGTGYYLSHLQQSLTTPQYYGIDIAKEAINLAAKQTKNIKWIISSIAKLPFPDQQLQGIISIFSPSNFTEFARILDQTGHVFVIRPSANHLYELRDVLFSDIKQIANDRILEEAQPYLTAKESIPLTYEINLNNEDLVNLFKMTPYYWRSTAEKKQRVATLSNLKLTIDIILWVFKKH